MANAMSHFWTVNPCNAICVLIGSDQRACCQLAVLSDRIPYWYGWQRWWNTKGKYGNHTLRTSLLEPKQCQDIQGQHIARNACVEFYPVADQCVIFGFVECSLALDTWTFLFDKGFDICARSCSYKLLHYRSWCELCSRVVSSFHQAGHKTRYST